MERIVSHLSDNDELRCLFKVIWFRARIDHLSNISIFILHMKGKPHGLSGESVIERVIPGTDNMRRCSVNCFLKIHVGDRKSTRLNSSHVAISYAVFCLKKKRTIATERSPN